MRRVLSPLEKKSLLDGVVRAPAHAVPLELAVLHELADVEAEFATTEASRLLEVLHRRLFVLADQRDELARGLLDAHRLIVD